MSLFTYLTEHANPALEIIDAATGEVTTFGDTLNELPDLSSAEKQLAFLYLDNSAASVKALLALLKTNHALALLNASLNTDFKRKLEAHYKPSLLFDCSEEPPQGFNLVYEDGKMKGFQRHEGTRNHSEIKIHDSIRILLSTSGTTGSQKFVKLTDNNFIANCNSILSYLPIVSKDVCVLNLPIHYSYGLSVLTTNLSQGGKIICTNETVLSRGFWEIFEKYGCTSLAGVPYTYEMLNRIGFINKKYHSLRYLTQAGGKLSDRLLQLFSEYSHSRQIPFFVMYGQTEATARMAYLQPGKLKEKPSSIGKAIKDGSFRLEKSGELVYKGPNVGCGYCLSAEDLRECICPEELHTGDLARVDDEGFYYITGRIKRFIKLFGSRISLDELETDLKEHYAHFVGCTGIEDKKLLVFSDDSSVKADEIKNYVSKKYLLHISVIDFLHIAEIPLMPNQKVDYRAVTDLIKQQ